MAVEWYHKIYTEPNEATAMALLDASAEPGKLVYLTTYTHIDDAFKHIYVVSNAKFNMSLQHNNAVYKPVYRVTLYNESIAASEVVS